MNRNASPNTKVIIVNGLRRGGTNIMWNILQSHPRVCSPILETGEILFGHIFKKSRALVRFALRHPAVYKTPAGRLLHRVTDRHFAQWKLKNLDDSERCMKSEREQYTRDEVDSAALCLKSVNEDIALSGFFHHYYEPAFSFGLIRNGFAVCEGLIRRGKTPRQAGIAYCRSGQDLIRQQRICGRFKIMKFEDILKDPFGSAREMFTFAELTPARIDTLRLRSKKILSGGSGHTVRMGMESKKYWFDSERISDILAYDIDRIQESALSKRERDVFQHYAYPVLKYFEYI
jgi:hypothetical protein